MNAGELLEKARAIGALMQGVGYATATLFADVETVGKVGALANVAPKLQTSGSAGLHAPVTIVSVALEFGSAQVVVQGSRAASDEELRAAKVYPAPVPYQPDEPEEEPGDIASRQSRIPKEYAEP